MTDLDDVTPTEEGALPRLAALVLGSAEIIALLLFIHLSLQSDDLGEAAALAAVAIGALAATGVILACLGRAPRVAVALTVAALLIAGAVWFAPY